jgi:hypothetical protein
MVSHKQSIQTGEELPLRTAKIRFAELHALPQDWDSYGGLPPTPRALRSAEALVAELAREYGRTLGETAVPREIFPIPDGGLELEWSAGEWMLGIEIGPEGDARYLLKTGRGSDAQYTKGSLQVSASEVNRLLSAFR